MIRMQRIFSHFLAAKPAVEPPPLPPIPRPNGPKIQDSQPGQAKPGDDLTSLVVFRSKV